MGDNRNLLSEKEYYDEYTKNVSKYKINNKDEVVKEITFSNCCKTNEKRCKKSCCKSK